MPKSGRQNPQVFQQISARIKELDGVETRAGWFESSKYEDGTSVAEVAAVQEFGATIAHPGGTPYKIGPDGRAIFVTKADGAGLPVTQAHTIVIPPRPFMRPTADREKNNWLTIMYDGAKAIVRGAATGIQVMDALGSRAAGDIAKSIVAVTSPPLKPGTIAARRRALTDKITIGSLDKPLVSSGIMLDTVSHTVGKES
jgi:hypothetical protein